MGVRQAARLKVEVERRSAADAALAARVAEVARREEVAEESRRELREECRALRFQNKRMASELAESKALLREGKLRSNARLATLSESVEAAERAAEQRAGSLRDASKAMQSAVLDLQRHLGGRHVGHHAVNSGTAQRLMDKLWDASRKICAACDETSSRRDRDRERKLEESDAQGDEEEEGSASWSQIDEELLREGGAAGAGPALPFATTSAASTASTQQKRLHAVQGIRKAATKAFVTIAAKQGSITVVGDTATHDLLRHVTQVCADVEAENHKLRAEVERLAGEAAAQAQAAKSSAKLVPKYRVAIVKVRAETTQVRQRVEELEQALARAAGAAADETRRAAATEAERPKYAARLEHFARENKALRERVELFEEGRKQRRRLLESIRRERSLQAATDDHGDGDDPRPAEHGLGGVPLRTQAPRPRADARPQPTWQQRQAASNDTTSAEGLAGLPSLGSLLEELRGIGLADDTALLGDARAGTGFADGFDAPPPPQQQQQQQQQQRKTAAERERRSEEEGILFGDTAHATLQEELDQRLSRKARGAVLDDLDLLPGRAARGHAGTNSFGVQLRYSRQVRDPPEHSPTAGASGLTGLRDAAERDGLGSPILDAAERELRGRRALLEPAELAPGLDSSFRSTAIAHELKLDIDTLNHEIAQLQRSLADAEQRLTPHSTT